MRPPPPPFPSHDEVEKADHETLCFWFQYLPGDGGDDAKWAVIQHINRRIATNWEDRSHRYTTRRATPVQSTSSAPAPAPKKKAAKSPKPTEKETAGADYFKSLFSDLKGAK